MIVTKHKQAKKLISILLIAAMLLNVIPNTFSTYAIADEGHTHTDSCYAKAGDLLCGITESEGHTHSDECYCPGGEYICGQEASEGHTHSDACYPATKDSETATEESDENVDEEIDAAFSVDVDPEPICGMTESEGHTHGDTCVCPGGELICELDESEGHTHDDNCLALGGELICGLEENKAENEEENEAANEEENEEENEADTPIEQVMPVDTEAVTTLSIEVGDYDSFASAIQTISASEQKSGTIVITQDFVMEKYVTIPDSTTVTLTDNGSKHTITTPLFVLATNKTYKLPDTVGLISIDKGGTLILDGDITLETNDSDTNLQGKTVTGTWIVRCNGKFVMNKGTLDGKDLPITYIDLLDKPSNERYHNLAMVVVCGQGAEFEMNNGTIKNAKLNSEGGAVKICCNGKFTMNGGKICNIDAEKRASAGAVLVYAGVNNYHSVGTATFVMNDGIIENNKGYRGSGVHVVGVDYTYRASFEMNGGIIRNNTATTPNPDNRYLQAGGAGVFVEKNAVFEMNDGEISNNTVTGGQGGGVCALDAWHNVSSSWVGWTIDMYCQYYPAAVTMNGGKICDNAVYKYINVNDTDNGCGGGIYLASNCVTLNAGVIEGNYAEKQGGGVYVACMPYVLKMQNALVRNNTATVIGGGLWACPTGQVNLSIANTIAFDNNTATEAGDDLASVKYAASTYKLNLPNRALGGGKIPWYIDGGITNVAFLGTGDDTPRYSAAANPEPLTELNDINSVIALKAVMSPEAKQAAEAKASLLIQNNMSSRGGGIGNNGSIVMDQKTYTYTLKVKKEWVGINDNQKTPVKVYLKLGDTDLGNAELNEGNNWTAEFTNLDDPSTLQNNLSYSIVEKDVPNGFAVSYSKPIIDEDKRLIEITVTNSAAGSLTLSKKVSGSDTPAQDTSFEFTITKNGTPAVGKYSINGGATQTLPSDGKLQLKANETALLTELPVGEYTVTETTPNQANYQSTEFSVNNQDYTQGLSATVTVTSAIATTGGGWYTDAGYIAQDSDGYFVYTVTSDQIDSNGKITVNCDPLAEYMEEAMRDRQNFGSVNFKVKFVNQSGVPIQYRDYNFDTVNWISVGQTYTPSDNPTLLETDDGADEYSAGYGWGEAWQQVYTATLNATSFDGNKVRLAISPLRCINPAIISYFASNPGYDTLIGKNTVKSAADITLLQMTAFPELIKQAFSFKDYQGTEISLPADSNRTYGDFICAFYGVDSLDKLTVTQKYNVLGTGYKGSPGVKYGGQAGITSYYNNSYGKMSNWCIPYSALNDGTMDLFKTWGVSGSRIEAGKKLYSGGQIFTEEDARLYAYQQSYHMLESDPSILDMAYEYLYERCIRLSFDNTQRAVSTAWDDSDNPTEDVSGIKSYIDKTDVAKANVLAAMNNGLAVADQETLTLDNIKGYIEVPNAWALFRYYDFGFDLIFQADTTSNTQQAASVAFINNYDTSSPNHPGHPKAATVTLEATKELDGETPPDNAFEFVLKNDKGEIIQTKQNKDGKIVFDSLKFSAKGSYVYKISEISGSDSSITYDDSVYTATITVTKSGNYYASVTYEKNGEKTGVPKFVNTTDTKDTPDEPNVPSDPDEPTVPDEPNITVVTENQRTPENSPKPQKPLDNVPKTGDDFNLWLYTTLLIISLLGMAAATIFLRKRSSGGR